MLKLCYPLQYHWLLGLIWPAMNTLRDEKIERPSTTRWWCKAARPCKSCEAAGPGIGWDTWRIITDRKWLKTIVISYRRENPQMGDLLIRVTKQLLIGSNWNDFPSNSRYISCLKKQNKSPQWHHHIGLESAWEIPLINIQAYRWLGFTLGILAGWVKQNQMKTRRFLFVVFPNNRK